MNTLIKINLVIKTLDEVPSNISSFVSENRSLFTFYEEKSQINDAEFLFIDNDQRLKFFSKDLGILFFNFEEEMNYHRHKKYILNQEPLAKALGLNKIKDRVIWDVTCGTGKDALLISSFGGKVIAFERNPIIYLLIQDALNHSSREFFKIYYGDSSALSLPFLGRPDVIYYDPMYPEKKKSALPRKEMQIFKTLIGPDTDSLEFLKWARTKALERVVVKRPSGAVGIMTDVSATYEGKSTRYDMYKIFSKS